MKTSIICGLHRSGTTYVGKIISLADSCYVIHEPFNPVWGLKTAPPTYTYWTDKNSTSEQTIKKALSFDGAFSKPDLKKSHFKQRVFRLLGGRQHLQWNYLKVRSSIGLSPKTIIWKDPFCTFMAPYLLKHWKMKMVCLVRHPCAHYYSVSKQNWEFNIRHLIRQKNLINEYGEGISEHLWDKAKTNNLIAIAILWKIMIRMVNNLNNKYENFLVIRHEDLCETPETEVNLICKHLECNFTETMKAYIHKSSQGSNPEAPIGKVHGFARDSKALANIWKTKLESEKQNTIIQIVGKDMAKYV